MNGRWLMRMAQLARRPPSLQRVAIWAGAMAAVLIIAGVERLGLWPDWMVSEPPGKNDLSP